MKQKRRFISFLVAVCLLVGMIPTVAIAAETGKAIQLVNSGRAANISGSQEDSIYFGTYRQSSNGSGGYNTEPVKWRVLSNADGKMFLLADQNLDVRQYNSRLISITWEKSTIRSWLNGYGANENSNGTDYSSDNFIGTAFSGEEQSAICDTYVYNATQSDESSNPNPSCNTSGGNNTTDKIFLLSIEEAMNSSYFPNGNESRKSTNTAYVASCRGTTGVGNDGFWWLRSPGNDANNAAPVKESGGIYHNGYSVGNKSITVRPAFNLNPDSVLFTSGAVGGKPSGAVGADALKSVSNYSGSEWKLTLQDSSRSFSADVNGQTSASVPAGGSVQITYSGAQTGENEYVSVLFCDGNDNVLYYGNIAQNSTSGTATLNIPSGLADGNYTLKVFSEQCNGDKKTDYASEFQNIDLNVLPREETPNAVFTATNDNSGTLSDVGTSMKYSVDGGITWNDITDATMNISGVTAENDVKVYKPGDGTTISDSKVQTIDITQAAQPTGIDKTDCTTSQQNNGQITGVDTTMEYKLSTGSGWTTINANPLMGLTDGTYEVRVKASGTVLASTAVTVTIGTHTCVAQGDWQYNGTDHWKLCVCSAKVEEAAHYGGEATCTAPAVCETCLQTYGLLNSNNHTDTTEWIQTATTHTQKYKCCGAIVVAEENHEWENGVCTECGYECVHQYNWQSENGMYWQHCTICGFDTNKKAIPTILINGADKICRTQDYKFSFTLPEGATDAVYGYEFIGLGDGPLTPTVEDNLYSGILKATIYPAEETNFKLIVSAKTADGFDFSAEKTVTIQNEHSGGKVTCKDKAKCEFCGESYGELNANNHSDLEHFPAVAATKTAEGNVEYWYCSGCRKYYKDAAATQEIKQTDTVTAKLLDGTVKPDAYKYPQTGDNSHLLLWIALLFISGGAVTATTVYGRKKKRSVK